MTLSKLTGLLPKVLQGHFIFYASNVGYNYFIGEFYSGDFFFVVKHFSYSLVYLCVFTATLCSN